MAFRKKVDVTRKLHCYSVTMRRKSIKDNNFLLFFCQFSALTSLCRKNDANLVWPFIVVSRSRGSSVVPVEFVPRSKGQTPLSASAVAVKVKVHKVRGHVPPCADGVVDNTTKIQKPRVISPCARRKEGEKSRYFAYVMWIILHA